MVICLERDADLHMAQLMPLPLTVSCFCKIQIGFTFLVPAHPGSPGKGPLNGCVCVVARQGMHQGSGLSPLLFVIVMEAISREFRVPLPWELLYADDLAVIAETEEELIKRLNEWKDNVESKGKNR